MTLSPTSEQHRALAAHFSDLLAGVPDWDAPTPVPEWKVRDLAAHLTWFHDVVHGGSPYGWTRRVDPSIDPAAAFTEQTAAVQNILDDPAQAESTFSHEHIPSSTLGEVTAQFYVADLFMHTWDLARATGQEHSLDESVAEQMLSGMRPLEQMLRASGQYGPAQPVADDAPAVDRLMAFVGRDPSFTAAS